jgi:hypothetical protein
MTNDRIPVILCVDCEPDLPVWAPGEPSAWDGFARMTDSSDHLRDQLERATGAPAHFSWALRMDPQIRATYGACAYLPERFPAFFESVERHGDTLGVHPHAWRWDATGGDWVAEHDDVGWVETCLGSAFESFRDVFGRTPAVHRFGSGFMSTTVMNRVRVEGVPFDLTLEPGEPRIPAGRRWGAVWHGDIPDYADIPRSPYAPDRSDFRRAERGSAGDGFLAVPLSSGRYAPPSRVAMPRPSAAARLAHPVRSARGVTRRIRSRAPEARRPPYRLLAMWREWRTPVDFWDAAFAAVEQVERPYLAFAVRSDVGLPGGTGEHFDAIMAALLEDRRASRLAFTTLDRAHGALR